MIAWFQSDRQEDCGSSKVITVYFGRTHMHGTYSPSPGLAASALFNTLPGGAFNINLVLSMSKICSFATTIITGMSLCDYVTSLRNVSGFFS